MLAVREQVLLSSHTTLRLGGPAARFAQAGSEEEIVAAVHDADQAGCPLLILGGGSNLVIADEGFAGTVIQLASSGIVVHAAGDDGVVVEVQAGENWDRLVGWAVTEKLSGVECLAGIPGLAGATPIQNVGAYGQEVASVIAAVRVYDRVRSEIVSLAGADCGFGYRTSIFKRGQAAHQASGGTSVVPSGTSGERGGIAGVPSGTSGVAAGTSGERGGIAGVPSGTSGVAAGTSGERGGIAGVPSGTSGVAAGTSGERGGIAGVPSGTSGLAARTSRVAARTSRVAARTSAAVTPTLEPTGRYVVLAVTFRLERSPASAPVRYPELAARLGVAPGERAPLAEVADAVLQLRRGKGMVLDPDDPDTHSAGSFFVNPVLDSERFARLQQAATALTGAQAGVPWFPAGDGLVKVPAAWLIEQAGFAKGYPAGGPARISSKHTLALTNPAGSTAAELIGLASQIKAGVHSVFGIQLANEPVLVGLTL